MNSKLVLIIGIITLLLNACGEDDISSLKMGEDFVNSESGIILTDSLSIRLSTVIVDSVQTSNTGVALVGSYNSSETGQVKANAIFRINLCEETVNEDNILDSITLCLKHNQYYIGDTSALLSFKIHQLETDLEDLDGSIFHNTTQVSLSEGPIGSVSYYPSPYSGEEYEFKLNDTFSKSLFDLFINDADEISDNSSFLEYIKGIAIKTDDNKAIIGFLANENELCLKMYYHNIEIDKEEFTATFPIEISPYQFNTINGDRSNSLLNGLAKQEEDIAANKSNNLSFIQGGTSLMTKVKFPGLANIFQLVLLNQIIKAELVLYPTKSSIEENDYILPSTLSAYTTNNTNSPREVLTTTDASAELPLTLVKTDHDYEETYYYTIDITQYIINELLEGYFDPDFALLIGLTPLEQYSSTKSITFGGEKNADYTPQLKLYTYYY